MPQLGIMRSRCRQKLPATAVQLSPTQRKGIGAVLAVRPRTCGAASAVPPCKVIPIRATKAAEIRRMMVVTSACLVTVQRTPEVDVRIGDEAIVGALQAGEHAVDVMGDVDLEFAAFMVVAREPDARGVGERGGVGLQGEVDEMAVCIG